MKLIKTKKYTKCMLRLYEEDYSDIDVLNLINKLKENLSVRITCVMHTKDNAKNHFHLMLSNGDFKPSALYKLGLKESECSDMEDTKGVYFYITQHKGKQEEDKINNHHIEVLLDEHKFVDKFSINENKEFNEFNEFLLSSLPDLKPRSIKRLIEYATERDKAYMIPYIYKYTYVIINIFKEI